MAADSPCFRVHSHCKGGSKVYDVSEYMERHPGGAALLIEAAEAELEADAMFEDAGHSVFTTAITIKGYLIGELTKDCEEDKGEGKGSDDGALEEKTSDTEQLENKLEKASIKD